MKHFHGQQELFYQLSIDAARSTHAVRARLFERIKGFLEDNTPDNFIEYFLQLPPYALAVHRNEAKDAALSLLEQYASYQSALKASLDKLGGAPGVDDYLSLLVQSPEEPEGSVPPVSVSF